MNGPASPDVVRRALSFIPSQNRDTWLRMGMAVKSELGESGFSIWNEWSQQDDAYNKQDAQAVWRSIREDGKVGIGTLFYEAKTRGFELKNGESRRIDLAEVARLRAERDVRFREEAEKRAREERAAAKLAEEIYKAAIPADDSHPYLRRKGIAAAASLRCGRWWQVGADGKHFREKENCLLVPMRDGFGRMWNLQAIFPEVDAELERDKDYLLGGRKQGMYFSIGKPEGAVALGEGFATMQSVRTATGLAVCIAFDKGNLLSVAKILRDKLNGIHLVVAADNDIRDGKPNHGLDKAREAAQAVGGFVAVPEMDGAKADFNDLYLKKGADAVKAAISAAHQVSGVERAASERAATTGEAQPSRHPVVYSRLSSIEAKPIRWLWPGRIARGKVSMIAGHPGLGKSQITSSLAAIVTTGGRWPVDRAACERGSVMLLSAEDDPADTIRPRLEAAGADLERVHILHAVRDGFNAAGDEIQRSFNLKEDIRRLESALDEIGDVALVVIDPVSAYLGGADSHNNADVRALLAPLSEMAARAGAAVVAVSHLNKGGVGGSDALMRVTGSLAFVAASRAAFIVAKDPENERRRLFLPAKNNVAADIGGLAFAIESCTIGRGIETSRVSWEAEPVSGTNADEVLRAPTDPYERNALDDARAWVSSMLADGPMPSKAFMSEAKQAGHQERTMFRARSAMKVEAFKDGAGGHWMVRLPPKTAMPSAIDVWQPCSLRGVEGVKNAQDCHPAMAGGVGSGSAKPEADGGEEIL